MQTLTEIRSLLSARGIRPKHRFGQNFLHDQNILRKLIAAASIAPGDLVLEVGPGTGTLTEALLECGARVIACEIDRDMIEILREHVLPRSEGRLTIVEGDCLDGKHALAPQVLAALTAPVNDTAPPAAPAPPAATAPVPPFRLVANLPYGSATPLLATLLSTHQECTGLVVTIQREVADRLLATPRSDAYGPLSVLVSLLSRVERIADVASGCFWPAPTVTSAMIAIHPHANADRPSELRTPDGCRSFERFVGSIFSRRRKQLGTILGRTVALPPELRAEQRPEELTPAQWLELWRFSAASDADTPSG